MRENETSMKVERKSEIDDIESNNKTRNMLLAQPQRIRGKNQYLEPPTHTENKNAKEIMFGSCLKRNLNLSPEEIQVFGELREDCIESFDPSNQTHVRILGELWYLLKGEEMDRNSYKSEEWVKFGFQNQNPCTDFRGGGIHSLLQMVNFVRNNQNLVLSEMTNPKNDFFFAISSINVTFFLKVHLHLAAHLNPKLDKNVYCERRSLKNFCVMLSQDDKALDKIHDILLKDMFNSWETMRKNKPQTTLIDFPIIEKLFKDKFKNIISGNDYLNVTELISAYQR